MTYAVCVSEEYVWVVRRYVDEGQSVAPGAPLVDVMTPEGVVQTLRSEGWGVVSHIEGKRFSSSSHKHETGCDGDEYLCADDGSDFIRLNPAMAAVFVLNAILCHIVARPQDGVRKQGFHPRNAASVIYRKTLGLAGR